MATGGEESREDRLERRTKIREEQFKELQKSLMDQGVELSDDDIPDVRKTFDLLDEGEDELDFDETQDNLEKLSEIESGKSEEISEDEELVFPSSQIKQRTDGVQARRSLLDEKMSELERRENLARQREEELIRRKESFEQMLKSNEEKKREAMRRQRRKEMFVESDDILKQLEEDLAEKQRVIDEREKEMLKREKNLLTAEEKWKDYERKMERKSRELIRQEVDKEMSRCLPHNLSTSTRVKQEENTTPDMKQKGRRSTLTFGNPEQLYWTQTSENKDIVCGTEKDTKEESSNVSNQKLMEEESERSNRVGHSVKSSVEKETVPKVSESAFYMKPYLGTFSGTSPKPKNESSVDDWKLEVESLIAAKIYPDVSISQAIRKSLKNPAKRVLLPMSPAAKPREIIERVESVFGNVASGDAVLEEFYTSEQQRDESVADWGLRLEELMQRAVEKGHVEDKGEKLRRKFWRSLCNQDLKNATRTSFESGKTFEELRKKAREEEFELNMRKGKVDEKKRSANVKAQHQPLHGDQDSQFELLKGLMEKMEVMEKKVQRLGYRRGRGRGRPNRSERNQNEGGQKQDEGSMEAKNEPQTKVNENKKQEKN